MFHPYQTDNRLRRNSPTEQTEQFCVLRHADGSPCPA
nr:MAG TPA: hypothetical protein [Caudoviricetes sp.]